MVRNTIVHGFFVEVLVKINLFQVVIEHFLKLKFQLLQAGDIIARSLSAAAHNHEAHLVLRKQHARASDKFCAEVLVLFVGDAASNVAIICEHYVRCSILLVELNGLDQHDVVVNLDWAALAVLAESLEVVRVREVQHLDRLIDNLIWHISSDGVILDVFGVLRFFGIFYLRNKSKTTHAKLLIKVLERHCAQHVLIARS